MTTFPRSKDRTDVTTFPGSKDRTGVTTFPGSKDRNKFNSTVQKTYLFYLDKEDLWFQIGLSL